MKDQEIMNLQDLLRQRDIEIEELKRRLRDRSYSREKIVHREIEPIKEVRYEKDPYLIQENKRLGSDYEKAVLENQELRQKMDDMMEEIRRLQKMLRELKARPPKNVEKEVVLRKLAPVNVSLGPRAEILMDMYKKKADKLAKTLGMNMLYYYRLFKYYFRLSQQNKERVLINQKLEVVDGTYEVWVWLRERLVDWLFEIFVRSVDRGLERKM